MPTPEVKDGRAKLFSRYFQQQNYPADHFHHILLQACKGELNSWADLKDIVHGDTIPPTIRLNDQLSWSTRDREGAPGKDELFAKNKRFMTLGRILLHRQATESLWVLHEHEGRAFVGILHDGRIWDLPGYLRNLERDWKDSGRGNVCDWSAKTEIGEVDEDLMNGLKQEIIQDDNQSTTKLLTLASPFTPPQSPSEVSREPAKNLKHLSREEYRLMDTEQQRNYREDVEQERMRLEAELKFLTRKNSFHSADDVSKESELFPMSLAERFLARHVSSNMQTYLHSIPRDTVENCGIADKALDEVIAKRFAALRL